MPNPTKKLYIIIKDCGDGSFYPKYTFDDALIEKLRKAYRDGVMDYENGIGVDGDGFHYDTMTVPADATYESLGIRPLDTERFSFLKDL